MALVDPGRDRDPELLAPLDPASPRQVSQGVSTIRPSPWQRGQAVTLTIWPSIVFRTLRVSPRPLQLGQVVTFGARLRAVAAARLAALEDRELDLLLGPLDRLVEGDPQVVAEVGAGGRSGSAGAAPGGAAEERIEDVAEAGEVPGPGARRRAPFTPARPNRS